VTRRGALIYGMVLLCCCTAMLACAQNSPKSSPADKDKDKDKKVSAEIGFTCLWWSESQMEGLNPNSPPPKNTEVKLTKWEYSDPVGVPHPDVIDVVVTLKNPTHEVLSNLLIEIGLQWEVGPSRKQTAAAWSERSVLSEQRGIEVQPGGEKTVRVTIDLKKKMDELEKQRKWPFALRASAEVRVAGASSLLSETHADLPIKPGD
jgi:hypothetical protein